MPDEPEDTIVEGRRPPGIPRPLRRGLLAAVVAAAVAVPVTGAPSQARDVQTPAPPALPAMAADTLDARYRLTRQAAEDAAVAAERADDTDRAAALRALAAPGRHFLSFDGRGRGRAVEVVGDDLATASTITVLVPGADTTVRHFDSHGSTWAAPGGGARALARQLRADDPGGRHAVVAWLGYDTPETISGAVITPGRAREGARGLLAFLTGLRAAAPHARLTLLCHSYGSVVCGSAGPGLDAAHVADVALYGSPGSGATTAAGLDTAARIWAGRASGDGIARVPHVSLRLPLDITLGLGTDPVSGAFGAHRFAAGSGGHGDYLRPGGTALRNLALIALGRTADVTATGGDRA
ncbi:MULTISPECIES: alpha/beta hydrolase [Streptomyces]|uniref:Alpha/beta hydrolase family protein n=1 Tax=Streptomyces luteosporeus TaxID=173856 RepID=A0ABP6FZD0_9ACTN